MEVYFVVDMKQCFLFIEETVEIINVFHVRGAEHPPTLQTKADSDPPSWKYQQHNVHICKHENELYIKMIVSRFKYTNKLKFHLNEI